MDLNHLYSQHQLSVMRAAATTSRLARTRHLAAAGAFANRIQDYQQTVGAPAATGWLAGIAGIDCTRPIRQPNPGLFL